MFGAAAAEGTRAQAQASPPPPGRARAGPSGFPGSLQSGSERAGRAAGSGGVHEIRHQIRQRREHGPEMFAQDGGLARVVAPGRGLRGQVGG